MREIWTIPTTNITYTRSQNYTNLVVGKHEIQTFKVMVVVVVPLLIIICVHISAHPLLFLVKWFVQIYLNVNFSSSGSHG